MFEFWQLFLLAENTITLTFSGYNDWLALAVAIGHAA